MSQYREDLIEKMLGIYREARKQREEIDLSNERQQAMLNEISELDYDELLNVLMSDVAIAFEKLNSEDNQFSRRTLLRSIFAFVEGVIYTLKQEILLQAKHNREFDLKPEEMLACREEIFQVEKTGEIKSLTKYVDLLSNIRLTFKFYAKAFSIDYKLDISGGAWQSFQRSLKVRHRITHPKHKSDMNITDQELVEAYTSYQWIRVRILEIIHTRIQSLKNQRAGEVQF